MEAKQKSRQNFHESYGANEEVKPPSARSTGLVFVAVSLLLGVMFRHHPAAVALFLIVALTLLAFSLLAPQRLEPLSLIWFKFGMLLSRIVNPIVMFLMFALAIVPMGLLMRLFADPLRSKREPDATTYWLEPDPAEAKLASMKNQF
ncbi:MULTISPECIES: hypothetical protein [Rhodomicrobium]|uniref:hypothetical protein n=1 Tax=Rhodomicrobium TaxID=1068 RepID=UPI000B4B8FCC|nr:MULTISPECIES: hypothetical protein [Rhodomicrobium]